MLFLDEPSSGLDSEMAAGVMNSLVRLAQKGRTVVSEAGRACVGGACMCVGGGLGGCKDW